MTALFADVTGFTELADRIDPEELAEIISAVIAVLSDVVGRYDGYVDKYSGDALLAFFGAPTSHEDDAERAVAAALEMHEQLETITPGLGEAAHDLGLHIGINTGHAIALVIGNEVRTDYSVLGDAVNVAQRLQSIAGPGETYVGALTERATSHDFAYEPLGRVALKGKVIPVSAWRLVGRRRRAEAASVFVGRRAERAALLRALERVEDLPGEFVVVSGPAGSGKTSLLESIEYEVQRRGVRWLEARAHSYRSGSPYAPVIELLSALADEAPPKDAASSLRHVLSELGIERNAPVLLGLLEGTWATDELEPETRRLRIHEAVCQLVRALAARQPLVLVFEDLHWADIGTLEIVAALAEQTATVPMLIVGTMRAGSPVTATIREILGDPDGWPASLRITELELDDLDDDHVRELVGAIGGTFGEPALRALIDRAGGNPFFATELVRSLADGNDESPAGPLPPTVEAALSARLDPLTDEANRLLDVAAAIGTEIPEELLSALAQAMAVDNAALGELLDADILEPSVRRAGVLHFEHGLLQEVAYARLLRRHAREIHARIANEVEDLYGRDGDASDLLAHHLYQADLGERAILQLLHSSARAQTVFANDAAMVHLRRALDLCERHGEVRHHREAVTLQLADLCHHVGSYQEATDLYRSMLGGPSGSRAACGLAGSLRTRGLYSAALEVLDAAATEGASADEIAHVGLERGRCLMIIESFDSAIASFRDALELVEFDSTLRGALLYELARAESSSGSLPRALAHVLEARDSFEASGDRRRLASALRVLGGVYEDMGRLGEATEALLEGLALAERIGLTEEICGCLMNLALVELAAGDHPAAIAHNRRAIEELQRIGHPALAAASANLAEALLDHGSLDEALRYCDQAILLASESHDVLSVADAQMTAARVHLLSGNGALAAAVAEEAAGHFGEVGSQSWAAKAREIASVAREAAAAGDRAAETVERPSDAVT